MADESATSYGFVIRRKMDGLYRRTGRRSKSWGPLAKAHRFRSEKSALYGASMTGALAFGPRRLFDVEKFREQFEILAVRVEIVTE